METNGFI